MSSISRSQAIALLWQRADLSYKFHEGQRVIDKAYSQVQNKLFVGNCSRRFGKTYWALIKVIETALRKKCKSIVATAYQTDLVEIILPLVEEILADCPEDIRPKFNKQRSLYQLKNGSTIKLVGLDKKPNGLRGNKLDGTILLDEAGFISNLDKIYSSVIVPATMYSDAKVIMISTQPTSPDHEFKKFCDKAQLENAYVKLTIFDNPRVSAEMIETYRKECLTESDFNREYLCKFEVDESLHIIPEFNFDKHTFEGSSRDEFFKYYRKYISFDIGVIDPTAFIYAYYDYSKQKLILECESELQGKDVTTEAINSNLEMFKDYDKPFKIIADNNNKILIQDLNQAYQKNVIPVSKDELHAMISELRFSFKQDKILISKECKSIISQLQNGIWNKSKTEFARQNKHHNDFIAALVYLVRGLAEYENPVPISHGIDPRNSFNYHIPAQPQSQSITELSKLFKI